MSKLVVWLFLLAAGLPAFAEQPLAPSTIPGALVLDATQLVEKIEREPGLVIIDARRQQEFVKGHIAGAVNLLDTDITPRQLSKVLTDKETPVVFYCNSEHCLRSSVAVQKAVKWGYHHVYWFRGGWQEWTYQELPISR